MVPAMDVMASCGSGLRMRTRLGKGEARSGRWVSVASPLLFPVPALVRRMQDPDDESGQLNAIVALYSIGAPATLRSGTASTTADGERRSGLWTGLTLWSVLGAIVILGAVLGLTWRKADKPGQEEPEGVPVQTITVQSRDWPDEILLPARARPDTAAPIFTSMSSKGESTQ